MSPALAIVQLLNGVQFGLILFLIAAGLTLVYGVMDFLNLAHGVQYMIGAYLLASVASATGSFVVALAVALPAGMLIGLAFEFLVFRHLYDRPHLDQVLATFGVIIFVTEAIRTIWGVSPINVDVPEWLAGAVQLRDGLLYPTWRILIIVAGIGTAVLLYSLINYTRLGMLIRAGSTNAEMVSALGVNIRRLFSLVFGFGAMLAGFAGAMVAPLLSVDPGMGDSVLILAFVVIVIGGIGSIRGAFAAAILVGVVETLGRSAASPLLRSILEPAAASQVSRAIAPMLVYVLMAMTLAVRPSGLFPGRR